MNVDMPFNTYKNKSQALKNCKKVMKDTRCDGIKLFPAFLMGVDGFKALRAVLPPGLSTYAVGGVEPSDFAAWLASGITGFGIGNYLYKVGDTVSSVGKKAKKIVSAYDDASNEIT